MSGPTYPTVSAETFQDEHQPIINRPAPIVEIASHMSEMERQYQHGCLIEIAGPAGTGKTTISKQIAILQNEGNLHGVTLPVTSLSDFEEIGADAESIVADNLQRGHVILPLRFNSKDAKFVGNMDIRRGMKRIQLDGFTDAEIRDFFIGFGVKLTDDMVGDFSQLYGGYPYLLSAVANQYRETGNIDELTKYIIRRDYISGSVRNSLDYLLANFRQPQTGHAIEITRDDIITALVSLANSTHNTFSEYGISDAFGERLSFDQTSHVVAEMLRLSLIRRTHTGCPYELPNIIRKLAEIELKIRSTSQDRKTGRTKRV